MAIPAVNIIWDDQSQIDRTDSLLNEDNVDRPIVMTVITADKGPEEWKHRVFGKDFYDYYGETPSFSVHGQPLIQAANVIDAGGYLTVRRVMPPEAQLATIGVYAELSYSSIQYVDPSSKIPVWANNNDGSTVLSVSNPAPGLKASDGITDLWSPVMTNDVTVDFKQINYQIPYAGPGSDSPNDPAQYANLLYTDYAHTGGVMSNNQTYALFMITDNGRGVSNKRFRISRDTTASKPVQYVRYFLEVMEGDKTLETLAFTMDPDIIEKDRNMSLKNVIYQQSKQLRCVFFDEEYEAMCDNIATLLNWSSSTISTTPISLTTEELRRADPLFGTDFYGNKISNLNITNDLNNVFGIQLEGGTNGWKKLDKAGNTVDTNYPLESLQYTSKVSDAFHGFDDQATDFIVPSDDVFDFDNNRIDAVFDANYPNSVKRAIEDLAVFREDFVYFRDMGIGLKNTVSIQTADQLNFKSRYCATYVNSYDIYDPYTRKQISVTVTYDLARLFVKHFINGRARPFCGIKYGVVIPQEDFVPGTLNFAPKRTPKEDQRQIFDDLRINYLSFYDGTILAMNSEYTSQTEYTQLSWINNVLAVQQVIKAIRVLCPKIRYSFLDGEDLQRYKKDVNELIIDKYSGLFKSFTIEYVENSQYDSNKIIYAVLKVQFRNFIQTEVFKIIALQS